MTETADNFVLALPKGRILKEAMPLLRQAGIIPEAEFDNQESRQLRFRIAADYADNGCA